MPTTSPSSTQSTPAADSSAAATSEKRAFRLSLLRDNSRTSRPFLNARQRIPSSFLSKIHPSLEKRSSVRTAFIGSTHSGAGAGMILPRSCASRTSNRCEPLIAAEG